MIRDISRQIYFHVPTAILRVKSSKLIRNKFLKIVKVRNFYKITRKKKKEGRGISEGKNILM